MRLILIRHPETTWNVAKKLQGSREGTITPEAKLKARTLVASWDNPPTAIFHGDNKRTEYLATLFGEKYKVPVQKTHLLNERDFGIYEGMTGKEVGEQTDFDPLDYQGRMTWKPEGGESIVDVQVRVRRFLKETNERFRDTDTILAVTSGVFIRTFLYTCGEINMQEMFTVKPKPLESYQLVI